MAWFRCFIRGENFPGQRITQQGWVGFYLTRFLEADNADDAESSALEALRAEPKLSPPAGYSPTEDTRVYFEEIQEVAASEVPANPPGFVWFPMKEAGPERRRVLRVLGCPERKADRFLLSPTTTGRWAAAA